MRTATLALLALLALGLAGCGDKTKADAKDPDVQSGVEQPSDPALPAELKNPAYEYFGLGEGSLMTYDVIFADLPEQDGTQQTTLQKTENGVATYRVARTGGLAQLGIDTVELRKDGVYTVNSSMGIWKSPTLVLPADVAVGKSWTAEMDIENLQGGKQKVTSTVTNKALRTESVKVPAGTYECLVVESTIKASASGSDDPAQNGDFVTKSLTYYAKGVGIVKLTGNTTMKDRTEKKVNIVLKSIADDEED
jgi:hypothetical protein